MADTDAGFESFQSVLRSSEPIVVEAGSNSDSTRRLADRLGICLSALCLVHCLLTPVLILLLPSLQLFEAHGSGSHIFHESFHLALLLVLPIVAVLAFVPGFRRHGDKRVFAWSLPGLALVGIVAFFFEDISWTGSIVSVIGSLMLIRAHMINRKLCACCETEHGKKPHVKFRVQRGLKLLHEPSRQKRRLLTPWRS